MYIEIINDASTCFKNAFTYICFTSFVKVFNIDVIKKIQTLSITHFWDI